MKKFKLLLVVIVIVGGVVLSSCSTSRPTCAAYVGPLITEVAPEVNEIQSYQTGAWPTKWSIKHLEE